VAALAVVDDAGTNVLLANLTPAPRTVAVGRRGATTRSSWLNAWAVAAIRLA
jgi:hypothetical protein